MITTTTIYDALLLLLLLFINVIINIAEVTIKPHSRLI